MPFINVKVIEGVFDGEQKHEIIKKLSIMHSKEAVNYMMEFLKE